MNRRAWVVVAAGVVALATTAGTGAVSSVSTDRTMTVEVVDDEEAYLGLATNATTENETTLNVTVSNQFPSGTTLEDVTVTHDDVTLSPAGGTLEPGDTSTVTFENATCDGTVTVTASGDDVAVELERDVDCT